jgi:two-component system chemotaxis response regulator CheB
MMVSKKNPKLKILIVDDSAYSRQTIKKLLEKSARMDVVGTAYNGQDAIKKILRLKPDAVSLDLEMPEMDGYTLLRWLMKENPLPVIVVSSHKHESTVFKALELGAVDFVVKPTRRASDELRLIEEDLLRKFSSINSLKIEKIKKSIDLLDRKSIIKKVIGKFRPVVVKEGETEVVAIGASTGGPTAIQSIISVFPDDFSGTVVISQHMPEGFTRQFAERMDRVSKIKVKEAQNAEPVKKGCVYICPGGHNMRLSRLGKSVFIKTVKSTESDKYVPSIDMMMSSVAEVYGSSSMGVILTGMGNDGKNGMKDIKKSGGVTIAESEESSVVYGMSREVIMAGSADYVLSLEDIPLGILNGMKNLANRTK